MSLRFKLPGPFQANRYKVPAHNSFALRECIVRGKPLPTPSLEAARRYQPFRSFLNSSIHLILFSGLLVTDLGRVDISILFGNVMPECRYRASIRARSCGFPLNTCGKDGIKSSAGFENLAYSVIQFKCQHNLARALPAKQGTWPPDSGRR
jgi:hypothetical protein